jgi:hypothetical protein
LSKILKNQSKKTKQGEGVKAWSSLNNDDI